MKNKIIVHNPTNFTTKKYRYYNIFFDVFVKHLRKKFDILENRYYIYANMDRFPVKFIADFNNQNETHSTIMQECEMILENYDTKELKILSVSDSITDASVGLYNNDRFKPYISKILISQFNRQTILDCTYSKVLDPVFNPWIYFPSNLYNFKKYYDQRKIQKQLIDKMYFRGSGLEHRPIIKYLNNKIFHGGQTIGSFDTYAREAITYKVGLSCAGSAQFCYRDIEYMAMGIPMIRFEYSNEMDPPLIPNFHYISVKPKLQTHEEHVVGPDLAFELESRYLEVKNDTEFLHFISKNAKEYYDSYIHNNNGIRHTYKLLNLDNWS